MTGIVRRREQGVREACAESHTLGKGRGVSWRAKKQAERRRWCSLCLIREGTREVRWLGTGDGVVEGMGWWESGRWDGER